jgi:hypothetical protein
MRTISVFNASKLLAVISLLLLSPVCFAQNKASIKGSVVDSASKTPVEFATVAIVNAKDTSLISYTITQKDGVFKLSGLPSGIETRLIISTIGYNTSRQTFVFKPGEAKNVGVVSLNTKTLAEITIKGERSPVVIKKDTLEFNTEAFKTRPNAVVEDLLRLLPGVQINMDGSILVNGKTVNKLLIDGKRFFGSDPTVGTKNLDADLVDKVQVYDDREEDPDHKLTAIEVGKIINLKMKSKIKKSIIGKIYAGGGTRGRYEAGGIISSFRDTLQVSVIGLTNNLTRTGFSSSELTGMGGFNRSGGNVQYDGTFGGNGDGGIERMRSGGFNINNDYGKKLKVNLMYFYYNYVKDYNTKTLTEQTLDQTLLTTNNKTIYQLRQQRHSASTLIELAPDTTQHIRFDARLDISPTGSNTNSLSNSFNTQTPQLSNLQTIASSNSLANEFTDNFTYYKKLKKQGASFTIYQSLYLKNSHADDYNFNDLTSFTPDITPSLLDRYINGASTYYLAGVTATLNTPFSKKVKNELSFQSRYWETSNKLSTYDNNGTGVYNVFLSDQSNDLVRNTFIQNLQDNVSIDLTSNTMIRVGLNLETHSIADNFHSNVPNTSRLYKFLFPVFKLDGQNYNVDYYESIAQPEIYQMQPITLQISPVEKLTGNPNLTPTHSRDLSFSYYGSNNDKQSYINVNGGISLIEDNVIQVSTKDDNGFVTSTFANKNGGWTARLRASRGKQFKKSQIWQINLNNGVGGYYNQQAFFFNGDGGTQHNYSVTGSQSVGINYRSIVSLNSTYALTAVITNYAGVDYASVNSLRHRVTSVASVTWPKNFIFDAQYQYNYNPQIPAGFSKSSNVVNLAVTMQMLKQNRGQVKLSVYDLLDQNTTTYRYAVNNSITSGEQQILKRYFFINYQYKLNSIKSKK